MKKTDKYIMMIIKIGKKLNKVLDNIVIIWYNINIETREEKKYGK